ncbi:MAG: hypothetical protein ABSA11_05655 [Candidatus Bathyarchaeia archaeon]|jgi:hypothetical protein
MSTIRVGKWDVPADLFNDYIRFSIMANTYLDPEAEIPTHSDYERALRWKLCVQEVMRVHRAICAAIGVPYSENTDDEFYMAFHREVNKQTKLKGGTAY